MSYSLKVCHSATPIHCDCCSSVKLDTEYYIRSKFSVPKSIICTICHNKCHSSMVCEVNIPEIWVTVDENGIWHVTSKNDRIILRGRSIDKIAGSLAATYCACAYFGLEIKISTNVSYLVQCFTNLITIWQNNGWINTNGYPVKHSTIIQSVLNVNQGKTKFEYIGMKDKKYRIFELPIEDLYRDSWKIVLM